MRVRQAISYAIDKKAVNEIAESGLAKIIGTHASPNDPWFLDLSDTYQYDPAKAKELLKEAGVSNLKLTLQVPPVPYATSRRRGRPRQPGDVGIDVTLKDIEFPLWIDQVFTKADYDLTIISHVEARDIDQYGNPQYYWRYDNPKVQDASEAGRRGADRCENAGLYQQVQRPDQRGRRERLAVPVARPHRGEEGHHRLSPGGRSRSRTTSPGVK